MSTGAVAAFGLTLVVRYRQGTGFSPSSWASLHHGPMIDRMDHVALRRPTRSSHS